MLGSLVLYAGVVLDFLGLILLLVRSRRVTALVMLGIGSLLIFIAFAAPAREHRIERPVTHLDAIAPRWQFGEFHSTTINASPDQVFRAIREVRADDILFFQTLTWIRRGGAPLPDSILDPGRDPIIDVALRGGFELLAEDPPRELVLGTVITAPPEFRGSHRSLTAELYRSIREPGFVLASMNFLVQPRGAGSVVSTETRVFATSAPAARRFARYWRAIYPGSALIRRMWLRAIKQRIAHEKPQT